MPMFNYFSYLSLWRLSLLKNRRWVRQCLDCFLALECYDSTYMNYTIYLSGLRVLSSKDKFLKSDLISWPSLVFKSSWTILFTVPPRMSFLDLHLLKSCPAFKSQLKCNLLQIPIFHLWRFRVEMYETWGLRSRENICVIERERCRIRRKKGGGRHEDEED